MSKMSSKEESPYNHDMFKDLQENVMRAIKEGHETKNAQIIENQAKAFDFYNLWGPLDQMFRLFLMDLVEKNAELEELRNFIDLSIETARKDDGIVSSSIAAVLVSDIFQYMTIEDCELMFFYVEKKLDVWKEEIFYDACKYKFIQLCNDLVKRIPGIPPLSNEGFIDRIQLFLTKLVPLSKCSKPNNIHGEFNLEDTTEYGMEDDKDEGDSLYLKFWRLQDFFDDPTQIFNEGKWEVFRCHTIAMLSTFKDKKLEHVEDKPETLKSTQFFSQYLTSPELFNTEMNDASFRKQVLVQFLITFQYLTLPVELRDGSALSPNQTDWIQAAVEEVYSLMRETPSAGEVFVKVIRKLLLNEEFWIQWKNDGSPKFSMFLPSTLTNEPVKMTKEPKRHLGDILKEQYESGILSLPSTSTSKPVEMKEPKRRWGDILKKQQESGILSSPSTSTSKPVEMKEPKRRLGDILKKQQESGILSSPSTSTSEPVEMMKKSKRHLGDILKEQEKSGIFDLGKVIMTKIWNRNQDSLKIANKPTLESYFKEAMQLSSEDLSELLKDEHFTWGGVKLLMSDDPDCIAFRKRHSTIDVREKLKVIINYMKAIRNETTEDDLLLFGEERKEPDQSSLQGDKNK